MFGYCRTLREYLRTPKGRHDALDYAGAAGAILFTALLAGGVLYIVTGE